MNYIPAFTLSGGPPAPSLPPIPDSGNLPLGGPNNNVQPKVRPTSQVVPAVANYNLAFQYQWTRTMTMEMAYVGNVGRHGFVGDSPSYNVNPVNIVNYGVPGISQAQRQYFNGRFSNGICCSGGILGDYLGNDANSNYNSLQVKVTQNMNHGLQFIAFYTWSRALHYGDQNYYAISPAIAYGPWDQNRSQVFVTNMVWDLPFGKGKTFAGNASRAEDLVIGGWQITGTLNWSSGLPFTPSYGACNSDEDVGVCRPNKGNLAGWSMGGGSFDPINHWVPYFTPVSPVQPTGGGPWLRPVTGTLGDAGIFSLYGPRFFTANASVMKNFKMTERFALQFRMDAFNVFNHPVLGFNSNQGNTCIDCGGNAGKVTDIEADTTMRELQFALKLTF